MATAYFDPVWLHSFLAVADSLSFTRAADELGITQPAVSQHVRRLEAAAATLGASPPVVFLTVTLPLVVPGILAGMILTFAKAMGEFGATITFVFNIPGQTQTLPSAIYALLQVPGGEQGAARLVIVSIVVAMTALVLSEVLARRAALRLATQ